MIRTLKLTALMVLVAALLATVAACASAQPKLEDTQWRLSAWTLSSLQADEFAITARFSGGKISGRSGVNSYSGPYTLGPRAAFAVGNLMSTEMAGPEPAMRAESAYMTLLGQAKSYKRVDGKLTLYDEGGNESLIFETDGQ